MKLHVLYTVCAKAAKVSPCHVIVEEAVSSWSSIFLYVCDNSLPMMP